MLPTRPAPKPLLRLIGPDVCGVISSRGDLCDVGHLCGFVNVASGGHGQGISRWGTGVGERSPGVVGVIVNPFFMLPYAVV